MSKDIAYWPSKMASSTSTIVNSDLRTGRLRTQGYPDDYNIYESDVVVSSASAKRATTGAMTETHNPGNPPNWLNNYRHVPPHRPINRNLDQSQRRVYTSLAERVFLTMMFTGLEVNVVSPSSLGDRER